MQKITLWGGVLEVSVEQFEVQFALEEESGDVVRIPFEVVNFLQDFRFEVVVRGNIPIGENPGNWRVWVLLAERDGVGVPIEPEGWEVAVVEQVVCHRLLMDLPLRTVL